MSDRKLEALLACADAYYERGPWLQYDELSMDRVARVTPRRRIFLPPEAATEQNPVWLDCSGFIHAVYYNAFFYELPAKLTWHMIEEVRPRVCYRELTHEESEEELAGAAEELRNLLRPGDIVTYEYAGNGHTMLVVNDREFMHCTGRGQGNSYDYAGKKDRPVRDGAIGKERIGAWFTPGEHYYLFAGRIRRFAVSRPLAVVGDPAPSALARLALNGLRFSVLSSHPGGHEAEYGETVRYSVRADNTGSEARSVRFRIEVPEGAALLSPGETEKTIGPGESTLASFEVRVGEDPVLKALSPAFFADDLPLWAPPVLLRRPAAPPDTGKLIHDYERLLSEGADVFDALGKTYQEQGYPLRLRQTDLAARFFFPFDSLPDNSLWRRVSEQGKDASVPGLFGGYGVITPEMSTETGIRCTRISRRDLEPGDIVLVSDDSYGQKACAAIFDGRVLAGVFEAGEAYRILTEEETDRFLNSLLGRFVFIVLRPKTIVRGETWF